MCSLLPMLCLLEFCLVRALFVQALQVMCWNTMFSRGGQAALRSGPPVSFQYSGHLHHPSLAGGFHPLFQAEPVTAWPDLFHLACPPAPPGDSLKTKIPVPLAFPSLSQLLAYSSAIRFYFLWLCPSISEKLNSWPGQRLHGSHRRQLTGSSH